MDYLIKMARRREEKCGGDACDHPNYLGDLLRRGVICRWISGYARRFFDAYYGL
ncbi:MAG: hypothetical protein ACP5RJ_09075 [Conexivisphaera sp.]|jgi:hypothetical protein